MFDPDGPDSMLLGSYSSLLGSLVQEATWRSSFQTLAGASSADMAMERSDASQTPTIADTICAKCFFFSRASFSTMSCFSFVLFMMFRCSYESLLTCVCLPVLFLLLPFLWCRCACCFSLFLFSSPLPSPLIFYLAESVMAN